MCYSNFTFHSHHKCYTPASELALVFLSLWARLDLLLFLQVWFFPPIREHPSLKHSLGGLSAFRRQKTGMGQGGGGIFPCSGTVRPLQGARKSMKPCRCRFKQLFSATLGPREAEEERSQNSTANHKKLLLSWVTCTVRKVHLGNT